MTQSMRVLVLNPGSSSLKLCLWQLGPDEQLIWRGAVEHIGTERAQLWCKPTSGERASQSSVGALPDIRSAARAFFDMLDAQSWPEPHAIGQRVVHAGPERVGPLRIDPQLTAALQALTPWAPLHLPGSLASIESARARYPELPQVACFDTDFHHELPERAARLPLPRPLWERGVRRYGFHGLSYEYCVTQLGAALGARSVIAHLGSGASLCALLNGRPIDTSMSWSPSGGIPMSTRSGDLDPAVLLYLQAAHGYSAAQLSQLVEHEAGLLGISGSTGDVRELLARAPSDARAALAVDMFCYAIRKQIGAYAAALGGIDTLVFTGGVGEHAASIRQSVCEPLAFLGLSLSPEANLASAHVISAAESGVSVRVLPADEEYVIARHTYALCRG